MSEKQSSQAANSLSEASVQNLLSDSENSLERVKESKAYQVPGQSRGILEVFRRQYLLNLLVHKELRVRYRGSILGMLWSYAKPGTQFLVFFFAIGIFMGMNRSITNYVVYMFAGVVAMNYFAEILNNSTRSLVANQDLVKKIHLPRELFPVSSVWVAVAHLLPQLVILIIGALCYGWRPGVSHLLAIILAFVIVTVFALGLGLAGAAINVLYRDAENFVELFLNVATWASPVLYKWEMVDEAFKHLGVTWLWWVYQLNPMTVVVELFHYGFWQPTQGASGALPPHTTMLVGIASVTAIATLLFGEWLFRRYDGRFAQEL